MSAHEPFERLCALAITGDLDNDDSRVLGEHLYECASCRESYRDFHAIVEQGFPVIAPPERVRRSLRRWGMKKRFIRRAFTEGILKTKAPDERKRRSWMLAPAGILLVFAVIGVGLHVYGSFREDQGRAAREIALLTDRLGDLERQVSETSHPPTVEPQAIVKSVERTHERELTSQVDLLRRDYEAAIAAKTDAESQLTALADDLDTLRSESTAAHGTIERLQRSINETETTLAQANRELASLRSQQEADAASIRLQRIRLAELSAMTQEQAETINRERDLLAKDKDIRDLMGARNLRIVDVQDEQTGGKTRTLAGRIFYTQGKSLVFYAYDLQNKGNVSKVDFQVWGKTEGRTRPPRSLGLMYIDEPAQNRWMLKFEDPEILALIDQVFVTVEPSGGSKQPTGKQLLTAAFLNESANHP